MGVIDLSIPLHRRYTLKKFCPFSKFHELQITGLQCKNKYCLHNLCWLLIPKNLIKTLLKWCDVKRIKKNINGKVTCARGLEDLTVLKCPCYGKWSTDSMQSLSFPNDNFCRNREEHPKIHT